MTEARFSITRRNSAGDLITSRGDTGDELAENFMFLFGADETNRYFMEMRGLAVGAGGVVLTGEAAITILSGSGGIGENRGGAGGSSTSGGAPVSPAGDAKASAALITAAAKKSGKTKDELAGITVDEAKKLISGKE